MKTLVKTNTDVVTGIELYEDNIAIVHVKGNQHFVLDADDAVNGCKLEDIKVGDTIIRNQYEDDDLDDISAYLDSIKIEWFIG